MIRARLICRQPAAVQIQASMLPSLAQLHCPSSLLLSLRPVHSEDAVSTSSPTKPCRELGELGVPSQVPRAQNKTQALPPCATPLLLCLHPKKSAQRPAPCFLGSNAFYYFSICCERLTSRELILTLWSSRTCYFPSLTESPMSTHNTFHLQRGYQEVQFPGILRRPNCKTNYIFKGNNFSWQNNTQEAYLIQKQKRLHQPLLRLRHRGTSECPRDLTPNLLLIEANLNALRSMIIKTETSRTYICR